MNYGFTGSRRLTREQQRVITAWFDMETVNTSTLIITGGCIGVDAYVARIAYSRGYRVKTILPADKSRVDPNWRSWCDEHEDEGLTYAQRNERIVSLSDVLIAFPDCAERQRGSGTWMTIRFSRKQNIPCEIYRLDILASQFTEDDDGDLVYRS